MNVCKIVTDKIIEKMKTAEKNGTTYYWVKPFSEGSPNRAYAYDTLSPYSGANRLLLEPDEYLTYNKIQEYNKKNGTKYHIRCGAHSNIVLFYNTTVLKDKDGEPIIDEDTQGPLVRGFVKYYRVFSRQDVIDDKGNNMTSRFNFKHYTHDEITEQMRKSLDDFHRMINLYCKNQKIDVEIIADGTKAYFEPEKNLIRFPSIENFKSLYEYMHTIAHEIVHSTMIPLKRFSLRGCVDYKEMVKSYSKEELVAEIGAEMLIQNLCIPDDREHQENSIAYLQSWSKYLTDNPNALVSACAKAEKACTYILDYLKDLEITPNKEEVEH